MVLTSSAVEIERTHPRNGNIDGLRLIAAIGVIALHVGPYPDLPDLAADTIRSAFRWCVPFFFMLTGYYLTDTSSVGSKISIDRLTVPLRAYVVASLVFLPFLIATSGPDAVTLSTILRGTHGHLWYLTALIIALLTIYTYRTPRARKLLWFVAALFAILFVAISYYNVLTGHRYEAVMAMRELSGISAVLIGGWLKSISRLKMIGIILLFGGILVTTLEIYLLRWLGGRPADVQLFIGTLPIAAGLLGIAIGLRNVTPVWLAGLGRRESLGIYLYHPLAIYAAASILSNDIRFNTNGVSGVPVWIIAAVVSTFALVAMRSRLPVLRGKLDGM